MPYTSAILQQISNFGFNFSSRRVQTPPLNTTIIIPENCKHSKTNLVTG
jgi:hypothetical protein